MSEITGLIRNLFPKLAEDAPLLEELEKAAAIRTFRQGDLLIDYGAQVAFVPLVFEGVLKVMRENGEDRELLLYFLEAGQTCAASFSCCMIRKRSEVRVVADTNGRMAAIPLEYANRWMAEHESWREFVLTVYDRRMFALIDTIDRLAFSKLDEQLIDYLETRYHLSPDRVIRVSHAEIARDLSASREAISRLLKKLEDAGEVRLGRNKIHLVR